MSLIESAKSIMRNLFSRIIYLIVNILRSPSICSEAKEVIRENSVNCPQRTHVQRLVLGEVEL